MSKKISREKFLEDKFESFKKQLEKYLPEEEYKSQFETLFNDLRELLC